MSEHRVAAAAHLRQGLSNGFKLRNSALSKTLRLFHARHLIECKTQTTKISRIKRRGQDFLWHPLTDELHAIFFVIAWIR